MKIIEKLKKTISLNGIIWGGKGMGKLAIISLFLSCGLCHVIQAQNEEIIPRKLEKIVNKIKSHNSGFKKLLEKEPVYLHGKLNGVSLYQVAIEARNDDAYYYLLSTHVGDIPEMQTIIQPVNQLIIIVSSNPLVYPIVRGNCELIEKVERLKKGDSKAKIKIGEYETHSLKTAYYLIHSQLGENNGSVNFINACNPLRESTLKPVMVSFSDEKMDLLDFALENADSTLLGYILQDPSHFSFSKDKVLARIHNVMDQTYNPEFIKFCKKYGYTPILPHGESVDEVMNLYWGAFFKYDEKSCAKILTKLNLFIPDNKSEALAQIHFLFFGKRVLGFDVGKYLIEKDQNLQIGKYRVTGVAVDRMERCFSSGECLYKLSKNYKSPEYELFRFIILSKAIKAGYIEELGWSGRVDHGSKMRLELAELLVNMNRPDATITLCDELEADIEYRAKKNWSFRNSLPYYRTLIYPLKGKAYTQKGELASSIEAYEVATDNCENAWCLVLQQYELSKIYLMAGEYEKATFHAGLAKEQVEKDYVKRRVKNFKREEMHQNLDAILNSSLEQIDKNHELDYCAIFKSRADEILTCEIVSVNPIDDEWKRININYTQLVGWIFPGEIEYIGVWEVHNSGLISRNFSSRRKEELANRNTYAPVDRDNKSTGTFSLEDTEEWKNKLWSNGGKHKYKYLYLLCEGERIAADIGGSSIMIEYNSDSDTPYSTPFQKGLLSSGKYFKTYKELKEFILLKVIENPWEECN